MLVPGVLCLVFLGLAFLAIYWMILAGLFGLICVYFLLSYYRFSPASGDVQAKIVGLILEHLDWDGMGGLPVCWQAGSLRSRERGHLGRIRRRAGCPRSQACANFWPQTH